MRVKRYASQGMSTMDTCVILLFMGVAATVYFFPEHKWLIALALIVVVPGYIVWSSLSEGKERDDRFRELYMQGELKKEHYIAQVGEKYFQKHHPDETVDAEGERAPETKLNR